MKYIAIEGNIGAGKTSLVGKLARDFAGVGVYEKYAENPFLEKFYKDNRRYALHVELGFLVERYRQFREEIEPALNQNKWVISDYHFSKSDIFAKVNLEESEYRLFQAIYKMMLSKIFFPELYVFLNVPIYILSERIKKRGRKMENSIYPGYLEALNESYLKSFKSTDYQNILVINTGHIDFVRNTKFYEKLKNYIFNFKLSKRITHVNL
ncbi:MAG: deoxynucleoside kinase [bacterium]